MSVAFLHPIREPLVVEMFGCPTVLDQIHKVLDVLWLRHPEVPVPARMQMELACVEIGGNIVEHSGDDSVVRMRMCAEVCGSEVSVSFCDDGAPARVDITDANMPPELEERGRGLAIAVAVLDELHYRRDGRTNHWTLTRRLDS